MKTILTLIALILTGCGIIEYETKLQTQRRKVHDRHRVLTGQETEFYSKYDTGNLWSDNGVVPFKKAEDR